MLKLSEIKGEKAFDVLADLTEPIANIAADKKAAELLGLKVKSMGDILTDDECTVAPAVGTAVMMEKYLN